MPRAAFVAVALAATAAGVAHYRTRPSREASLQVSARRDISVVSSPAATNTPVSNTPSVPSPAPSTSSVELREKQQNPKLPAQPLAKRQMLRTANGFGRTGAYYVPVRLHDPMWLLVYLHGTGGSGLEGVNTFQRFADEEGFVILGPDSGQAPNGQFSWQVGDHPGEITDDRRHVDACLRELLTSEQLALSAADVMAVGFSGGGSSAPYLATNEEPFTAFAVLHGGVFSGGLGRRSVRGWFSTGQADTIRPPAMVAQAVSAANATGTSAELHLFDGGHGIGLTEAAALVAWWLGK